MKISGYIMGSIEAMLGCIILCGISVLKELLPKMTWFGYGEISFPMATTISVILIVAGIAQIVYFCLKKN